MKFKLSTSSNRVLFLMLMLLVNFVRSDDENGTESDMVWIVDGVETRFSGHASDEGETEVKSHLGLQNYGQTKPLSQTESDEHEDEDDYSLAEQRCSGTCVPAYECHDSEKDDDDDDEKDGVGVIDPRKKKYGKCPKGQVCCSHEVSNEDLQKCGISRPNGVKNRILSTSLNAESEFGEWPWMAILLEFKDYINKYVCGAVLINSKYVLTVAHCVFGLKKNDLKIRLGEWNTQVTNEALPHKDFTIDKIIIHPEFSNKSLHNNIAVIKLSDEVKFEPHIRPICLPKRSQSFLDQWCVTTGWGKNANEGGKYANIMKEVTVPVVESGLCQELLRKTKLGHKFKLDPSSLCAGGQEGRDSCKGDGGGPLVCQQTDGSYTLAGLVSWGIDCGEHGVPAVYSNIEQLMPFISQQTGITLNE